MKIGPYELASPVILAPMAGVTDLPFRSVSMGLGAGMVVGEMVASDSRLRNSRKSQLRGVHMEEPEPRAIQIVGWDPEVMAAAARYNVDQGASIIDINMGCPAKKVCKKLAGSALLGDERQVSRILDAVVDAVDVPVTLKIRTGISQSNRNGVDIARIAEDCGIQALAVHGRTRECMYKGSAEYKTIRDIKQAVSIPVIANGDINSVSKAQYVMDYTSADAVMIGRGAHGRPWFPGQVAHALDGSGNPGEPSIRHQKNIVLQHIQHIHEFYGEFQGVRIARKHIKWYTASQAKSAEFLRNINRVIDAGEQLGLIQERYEKLIQRNTDDYCGDLNSGVLLEKNPTTLRAA